MLSGENYQVQVYYNYYYYYYYYYYYLLLLLLLLLKLPQVCSTWSFFILVSAVTSHVAIVC